jgi:hypothetical protein
MPGSWRKGKVSVSREGKRREKWVARVALTTDQRIGRGPCSGGAGWLARLAWPRRECKTKFGDLLVAVNVDFYALTARVLLRLVVAVLFVDVDFFAVLLRPGTVFKTTDVFGVGFASLSWLDVDGEGFLVFRVTFPPVWELCLCFYLRNVSGCCVDGGGGSYLDVC